MLRYKSTGNYSNTIRALILLVILVFASILQFNSSRADTRLKLNSTSIIIGVNTKYSLYLTPDKISSGIKWKSSKPKVASVSKGTIRAKKAGSCVISATYKNKVYRCKVSVQDIKPVLLGKYVDNAFNRIEIKRGYNIEFGGSVKAKLNIINCYKDKEFNIWYTVEYNDGAYCNRLFKLTKTSGYKNLEVYSYEDYSRGKLKVLNTYVKEETIEDIIGFSSREMTIQKGYSASLSVINAGYKVRGFRSSNNRVVTVDKNGKIVAKKEGKARITARVDKYKIECTVNVDNSLQDKVKGRWAISGTDIVQINKESKNLAFYNGGSRTKDKGTITNIYKDRYGNIIVAADIKQRMLIDGKYLTLDKKVKYKVYRSKKYKNVTVYNLVNGVYTKEYYGSKTRLYAVS